MNGLYQTAAQVQEFCQSRGWQFCFIGGLAYIRWAEPRQTSDVDLTLMNLASESKTLASSRSPAA